MERVNRILGNQVFLSELRKLARLERERVYCGHGIEHLLSVARIAYIRTLEEGLPFRKETIYAAALLHDVGRAAQYETGIPHDQAGVRLAEGILRECGFEEDEREEILTAIRCHRDREAAAGTSFGALLYEADKASRECFVCRAQETCDWPLEKKNFIIRR